MKVCEICEFVLIVFVLVVYEVVYVCLLVEVLVVGGLFVLEVMFCMFVVLDVIVEMVKVEGGVVGVGILLMFEDVKVVKDVGV